MSLKKRRNTFLKLKAFRLICNREISFTASSHS